jgi:Fe-S-cluster containining protein
MDAMAELRQAVESAAGRAEVGRAIRAIYATVQQEIDQRRPRCDVSGRCCRFEQYGHRLYVTTLELAAFVRELRELPLPRHREWDGTGCPFQQSRLCGVHEIRPFGCRMFFCDPTSTNWQNETYERFHSQLKRLHEELGVPYFYVEWRQGLAAAGALEPLSPSADSL